MNAPTRRNLSTLQQCGWRGSKAQPGDEVEEEAVGMVPMLESDGLAQDKWLPQPASWFGALKRALLFAHLQLCFLPHTSCGAGLMHWSTDPDNLT